VTEDMWVFLIIGMAVGAYVGYYVGRWRAEVGKAHHEMIKNWNSRRNYRS